MKSLNRTLLEAWTSPYKSFLLALAVYLIIAIWHSPSLHITDFAFYNYLADAFLHKQLFLRIIPQSTHDLVLLHGRYYLYWPPLPAILLLPFVAIFGINFSDIVFTAFIAAINVGLVSHLLNTAKQKKLFEISRFQHALLTIFFAFGTVHFTLAPYGRVWSLGQEVAFLFSIVVYISAISFSEWRAFLLTGLALAAAMMTRNHMFLVGIWPAYHLISRHKNNKKLLLYMLIGIAPLFFAGGLLAAYNWARFNGITDLGLASHQMAPFFLKDYEKYGYFNIHYIPINFYYQYIYYPFPIRSDLFMGGSLFLLSPVFIGAISLFFKKKADISSIFFVLTIFAVSIPIFLLMGTGWVTFGPRYTLDFAVPLMILTAEGISYWSKRTLSILTFVSITHYLIGTLILGLAFT